MVPRVNSTQPTVPLVDYSQELGGPNKSQYPVSELSRPASNHSSPAPGSGTCGSVYGSVSGSSSHNDEDQTLQTSQHETRPQQALGTSPTQPPQPGHSSTPNQSIGSAVSRDRAASEQVSPPATQGQLKYPPFVEDAIWTSSNNSMNLPDHTANYSDREWQEYSDHLGALDIASQEWTRSRSGISTPANSTLVSGFCSLPTSPHNEPETHQYAPNEFRDDQRILPGGSCTRTGTNLRESTTPPGTIAASSSGASATPLSAATAPIIDTSQVSPPPGNAESGK
jgi:hypothetical protein